MRIPVVPEAPRTVTRRRPPPTGSRALPPELSTVIDVTDEPSLSVRTAAGLDVAYDEETDLLAAAVVVLDAKTLEPLETSVQVGKTGQRVVTGESVPRQVPALLDAVRQLGRRPDVLICDGQGIAHPHRFGLACHLGAMTNLPTIGVAKAPIVGSYDPPGDERGQHAPLRHAGETVGRALRTQTGVKPVYVSVGHRIDLDDACRVVIGLTPHYRLPETIRQADQLARRGLREFLDALAG